jgi:hypothetical protein
MDSLEVKVNSLEIRLRTVRAELQTVNSRVQDLEEASEVSIDMRHRFIDVYRRDVLKNIDRAGHDRINQGNKTAHEGHVTLDAFLFTSARRWDEDSFRSLYGVLPALATWIGKS